MNTTLAKLDLETTITSELKLYLLTAMPTMQIIPVFSYNLESAFHTAQQTAPQGSALTFNSKTITAKELLSKINQDKETTLATEPPKEPQTPSKTQFKTSLMYALNEDTLNANLSKRDQDDIKRVIGKI